MLLADLRTPCLVLDAERMERNIARLSAHLATLGARLRPHVKTCKSTEIARRMAASATAPITVSTIREAEHFFAAGFRDILYAVGIAPNKLGAVIELRRRGCDLTVLVDNAATAHAVAACAADVPALIEIDCDEHRAGIAPAAPELLAVAATLANGGRLRGVMTHAGGSYGCRTPAALGEFAERERSAVVQAAARLRAAGHAIPVISVGSTPTATFAKRLDGVTEVRAGVFVFQDLVMVDLGVCQIDDVALSVLTTVIGHQRDRGWLITDAGWMALSRDRGTAKPAVDRGYGAVRDRAGNSLGDLVVADTNQEHGIISGRGAALDVTRFPIGTLLRILPNHACATAAQHVVYHVVGGGDEIVAEWPRFWGW